MEFSTGKYERKGRVGRERERERGAWIEQIGKDGGSRGKTLNTKDPSVCSPRDGTLLIIMLVKHVMAGIGASVAATTT